MSLPVRERATYERGGTVGSTKSSSFSNACHNATELRDNEEALFWGSEKLMCALVKVEVEDKWSALVSIALPCKSLDCLQ